MGFENTTEENIWTWRCNKRLEKLHEELPDRNSSPIIIIIIIIIIFIRTITSRKMRWTENVARMEDQRKTYKILVGKRRDHLA
jgi:hypothetical protein